MKLKEQLFKKIKAQGKSIKTAETYWHYCEDYLLRLKLKSGDWFDCAVVDGCETVGIVLKHRGVDGVLKRDVKRW